MSDHTPLTPNSLPVHTSTSKLLVALASLAIVGVIVALAAIVQQGFDEQQRLERLYSMFEGHAEPAIERIAIRHGEKYSEITDKAMITYFNLVARSAIRGTQVSFATYSARITVSGLGDFECHIHATETGFIIQLPPPDGVANPRFYQLNLIYPVPKQVLDLHRALSGKPQFASVLNYPSADVWLTTRISLERAESIELYSLFPDGPSNEIGATFQGYRVLGRTTIADATTRRRLFDALFREIDREEADNLKLLDRGIKSSFMCFNPRHGITATVDGEAVRLVICFECHKILFSCGESGGSVVVNDSPQAVFNEVLREANVPISK